MPLATTTAPRPLIAHTWQIIHQPAAAYADILHDAPSVAVVLLTYLVPLMLLDAAVNLLKGTFAAAGLLWVLLAVLIAVAIVAAVLRGRGSPFSRAFAIVVFASTSIWLADMLQQQPSSEAAIGWNWLVFLLGFGYFVFLSVVGTRLARAVFPLQITAHQTTVTVSHVEVKETPARSDRGLFGAVDRLVDVESVSVSKIVGVDSLKGFRAGDAFAAMREKHSEEDTEEIFTVGTRHGTPDLAHVRAEWPRAWVCFRVLSIMTFAALGCVIGATFFGNTNFLPAVMILGAFAVPFAILIFYFEANVPRNVSIYQVIKMVLLGGVLSLIVAVFEDSFAGGSPPPWLTGIIEETAKVAALLLVLRDTRYRWTLNGLLLGGAVGVGFAGFETAGYAFRTLTGALAGGMIPTLLIRAILAPGAHAAWAAMNGAALWRVKGDRPFKMAMFFDWRFLRVFFFTIVLHALWDTPATGNLPFLSGWLFLVTLAVVGVLAFVQAGIAQVRTAQVAAGIEPSAGREPAAAGAAT